MANSLFKPVGAPVIQRVLLIDRFERPQPGYRFVSRSLPGHLIQLMIRGRTTHEANGRRYQMEPGMLIWYHEDEEVRGEVHQSPWSFYSLNFIAPALSPPPFESRVRRVGPAVRKRFESLLTAWRDAGQPQAVRQLRVQAALLNLLADLSIGAGEPFRTDPSAQLWWELETLVRQDLSRALKLGDLAAMSGYSPATIARSCRAAVGGAPMKRVKHIRMSLARGLVERSELRIKEIAAQVGYARVHEFSRDYRKQFGCPPSQERKG